MFEFLSTIPQDLHPMIVHFPIVLFMLSFIFALASRFLPKLQDSEWLLLVLGAITAPLAVITGLGAHLPYEETALAAVIEPHQFSAILGTLVMVGVTIWRYTSRRKGKDIGRSPAYLVFAVLGILWIVIVGGTGGQLVYTHAINVRGVNPLLP
ncbi:MAG: DUF2231 domain-containing protein [Anaerolineae bacterium]|jgi:uncharacterized membrane protein|nr:DUF2231 domain-containing protein [Anaerolineae bacterium]